MLFDAEREEYEVWTEKGVAVLNELVETLQELALLLESFGTVVLEKLFHSASHRRYLICNTSSSIWVLV